MKKHLTNKSNTKRRRKHGFLRRMRTKKGSAIFNRRRQKGRTRISVI